MDMLRSIDGHMTVALGRSAISSIHLIVVSQVGLKDSGTLKSDPESQGNYLRFPRVCFCSTFLHGVMRCATCTNGSRI